MAKPFRFYYLIIEAWKDVGYGGAFTLNPVRRIWEAEHTPLDSFLPHPASLFLHFEYQKQRNMHMSFSEILPF